MKKTETSRRGLRKAVPSIYSSLSQTTILLTAGWRLVQSFLKSSRPVPPLAGGEARVAQTNTIWAPSDFSKKSMAVITSRTWGTRSSFSNPIISMAMWQA